MGTVSTSLVSLTQPTWACLSSPSCLSLSLFRCPPTSVTQMTINTGPLPTGMKFFRQKPSLMLLYFNPAKYCMANNFNQNLLSATIKKKDYTCYVSWQEKVHHFYSDNFFPESEPSGKFEGWIILKSCIRLTAEFVEFRDPLPPGLQICYSVVWPRALCKQHGRLIKHAARQIWNWNRASYIFTPNRSFFPRFLDHSWISPVHVSVEKSFFIF